MSKNISFIAIVVLALSCRKEIPINVPNTERKIVLNALIQADSLFSANVFRSNHVQDRAFELLYLNNATVSVYENNNLIDELELADDGFYKSTDAFAEAGHQYEYRVAVPNLPSCSGVGEVLQPVPIINIDSIGMMNLEYDEFFDSYEETYQVYGIKFNDNPDIDNFYRLKVLEKGADYNQFSYWYDSYSVESNDAAIEVWPDFDGYYYFSDVLFNGDQYNFTLGFKPYFDKDDQEIEVYLEHISEDFFLYVRSADFQRETRGDALFSQTVQVLSNIENGFGIVGTSSVSKGSITIYGMEFDEKIRQIP